jgi:ABC-type transporter Mla subunit MlaD
MTDQKLLTEKLSDFPDPVDGVPGVACYAYAGPVAEAIHDLRETVKKLGDVDRLRNEITRLSTIADNVVDRLDAIERVVKEDGRGLDALSERLDVIETKRVGTVEATTQVSGSPAQDVVAILNAIKGVQ